METRTYGLDMKTPLIAILMTASSSLLAHEVPESLDVHTSHVHISEEGGFRIIESDGLPDHATGRFPNAHNPHAMSAQRNVWKVPLRPRSLSTPRPVGQQPFGVAVNGVPFDPSTAEYWNRDRSSGWRIVAGVPMVNLGEDASHAHVQPSGAYHYHGIPTGLVDRLVGASGHPAGAAMIFVGWAADGYPIYNQWAHAEASDAASPVREMRSSYRLASTPRPDPPQGPGGTPDGMYEPDWEFVEGIGDLDACNGRTGVTPEFPEGTYYYVLTGDYPFIPRCFHARPDASFSRKGPPQGQGGRRGPGGRDSGGRDSGGRGGRPGGPPPPGAPSRPPR